MTPAAATRLGCVRGCGNSVRRPQRGCCILMTEHTLLLLVGLPGSGKSQAFTVAALKYHTGWFVRSTLGEKTPPCCPRCFPVAAPPPPPHRRRRPTAGSAARTIPAGKSTLAQLFQQQGWTVINQDRLGDRQACEAACWRALSDSQSVRPATPLPLMRQMPLCIPACAPCIAFRGCFTYRALPWSPPAVQVVIDRCNHNAMQRSHWLDIARRVQRAASTHLAALVLELPEELCIQRAEARGAHATLPAAQAREVIQRFAAEWQAPTWREGFNEMHLARTAEEAVAAAAALLQSAPAPTAAPAPETYASVAGAMEVSAVEPAVPPTAARSQLNAGAPVFQARQPWHAPGLSPEPRQYGQHRQQQRYTSRADAAASWRCAEGGTEASSASGAADAPASPACSSGSVWEQQAQGSGRTPRGGQRGERPGTGADASGNIVPFPRPRKGSRERSPVHQQMHHSQHAAHDKHRPRPHPWQRHSHDQPSGFWLDADTGPKPILMFDANGAQRGRGDRRAAVRSMPVSAGPPMLPSRLWRRASAGCLLQLSTAAFSRAARQLRCPACACPSGCITSHTSMRRSAGIHKPRPGIRHLRRLKVRAASSLPCLLHPCPA